MSIDSLILWINFWRPPQGGLHVELIMVDLQAKLLLLNNEIEELKIWRKIDSDTVFSYVKSTDLQTMDLTDGSRGFRHAIKIKAVSLNDTLYSWSNQTEVAF